MTDRRFWRRGIGSEQRIANLLDHLARRERPVVAAYLGRVPAADRDALAHFAAPLARLSIQARRPDPLGWLRERFAPRPRAANNPLLANRSPARRRFVRRLLQALEPRVVIVEFARLTATVHPRPNGARTETAYWIDTHDLLHRRTARFRAHGLALPVEIDAAQEAEALATYDALIAIQANEARALHRLVPDKPVLVVPHGLELPVPVPGFEPGPRPIRIGFLGGRDPSNEAALHWFLDHVWPKLAMRLGDRAEVVVGGQIAARWQRMEHGMRIRRRVDSIGEFWPSIDIAINPVRFGSGLKIKNVEALAHARALLTTPIGAEGLEDAAPAGLGIAESASEWIALLEAWVADPDAIARIGRAGRAHAESHFSPAAAFAALDAALDALDAGASTGREPA
ncbi:MAG: glycosyltransferase [Myxococcota bacterium]